MNRRSLALAAITVALTLAGCPTDSELTQKEKDKMAREQERQAQKQAQTDAKMMREANQAGQRRMPR